MNREELLIRKIDKYTITGARELMVSEVYMEEILMKEGFVEIDDEYGMDSNLVCEYACWEYGFLNLGECGEGFIFVIKLDEMEDHLLEKYFAKGR